MTDLEVVGAIPEALAGRYVRTGPNPIGTPGADHHWFLGDGMVHGVELQGGEARWYRNRWVRSPEIAAMQGVSEVPAPAEGGAVRRVRQHQRRPPRRSASGPSTSSPCPTS